LAFIGLVVAVVISGVLLVLIGSEAATSTLAAGLTLTVTGFLVLAGVDAAWSEPTLGLAVVGSGCIVIGAGAAVWCRRIATAGEG
jgi:hypothetical protein